MFTGFYFSSSSIFLAQSSDCHSQKKFGHKFFYSTDFCSLFDGIFQAEDTNIWVVRLKGQNGKINIHRRLFF